LKMLLDKDEVLVIEYPRAGRYLLRIQDDK